MKKNERENLLAFVSGSAGTLALSDGTVWSIEPQDLQALKIVSRLLEVMELNSSRNPNRKLEVFTSEENMGLQDMELEAVRPESSQEGSLSTNIRATLSVSNVVNSTSSEKPQTICSLKSPLDDDNTLARQMSRLALAIAVETELGGGVLLHGALAEKNGCGIILAGPSDAGKTTASLRLRSPWRSMCDDLTLVIPDGKDKYRSHPWPTWSNFMFGGSGSSWDVQSSVLLKGIFFLSKSHEDAALPVGVSQSICLLVKSSEQASLGMLRSKKNTFDIRTQRIKRFENIRALARAVPTFELQISLAGDFWNKIENVLDGCGGSI